MAYANGINKPYSNEQLEVCCTKICFDVVQVIDQTGEEAEERLLLELWTLLFMHICKDQYENRENFGEVVDLGLIVVDTGSVSVVFDYVDDESRDGIQSLEGLLELTGSDAFKVAGDTPFGTDTEEQRRHILHFQNPMFRELCDEWNESLLRRSRLLEYVDPLLEIDE